MGDRAVFAQAIGNTEVGEVIHLPERLSHSVPALIAAAVPRPRTVRTAKNVG